MAANELKSALVQAKERLPLFDRSRPSSRADAPWTSDLAEEKHTRSGARQSNCERVLAAVQLCPGLTSAELAEKTGLNRHEAASRLCDLRNAGRVEQGPKRICNACFNMCVTWRPKE